MKGNIHIYVYTYILQLLTFPDQLSTNTFRTESACMHCHSAIQLINLSVRIREQGMPHGEDKFQLLTAHTNTHARRLAVCVKDYDRSSYFYPCHHRGIHRKRPQERTYCRAQVQGKAECLLEIIKIEGIGQSGGISHSFCSSEVKHGDQGQGQNNNPKNTDFFFFNLIYFLTMGRGYLILFIINE